MLKISKKKVGLAKLSYLQDPMSDRNFFLSATLPLVGGSLPVLPLLPPLKLVTMI
jgi:hypothetical protein